MIPQQKQIMTKPMIMLRFVFLSSLTDPFCPEMG